MDRQTLESRIHEMLDAGGHLAGFPQLAAELQDWPDLAREADELSRIEQWLKLRSTTDTNSGDTGSAVMDPGGACSLATDPDDDTPVTFLSPGQTASGDGPLSDPVFASLFDHVMTLVALTPQAPEGEGWREPVMAPTAALAAIAPSMLANGALANGHLSISGVHPSGPAVHPFGGHHPLILATPAADLPDNTPRSAGSIPPAIGDANSTATAKADGLKSHGLKPGSVTRWVLPVAAAATMSLHWASGGLWTADPSRQAAVRVASGILIGGAPTGGAGQRHLSRAGLSGTMATGTPEDSRSRAARGANVKTHPLAISDNSRAGSPARDSLFWPQHSSTQPKSGPTASPVATHRPDGPHPTTVRDGGLHSASYYGC